MNDIKNNGWLPIERDGRVITEEQLKTMEENIPFLVYDSKYGRYRMADTCIQEVYENIITNANYTHWYIVPKMGE